jgi:putative addiction module killer protein
MPIPTRKTGVFRKWMRKLKDAIAKAHIDRRIERLAKGNPGDARSVGDGISEMRIDYGPGYRVYYKDTGKELIIILCGGDKSAQQEDIAEAKRLAKEEEDDENE